MADMETKNDELVECNANLTAQVERVEALVGLLQKSNSARKCQEQREQAAAFESRDKALPPGLDSQLAMCDFLYGNPAV